MSTLRDVKFSVLELVPVRDCGNEAQALKESLQLAQHVEALGFERFWLAEHHNMDGIASSATAVLIGYIAGGTSRIRVGSGGVMLPNHPPLVVAEQFGTLEALYPGRIDLGLGRAPGADQFTLRALRRDMLAGENFPEEIAHLEQLLGHQECSTRLRAYPGHDSKVPIWLLGSSLFSAQLAAQKGLPYAFASHFAPALLHEALHIYRTQFCPSAYLEKPYVMVGVPLLVADSDHDAKFLATTAFQRAVSLMRGESLRMKPPVDTMAGRWHPEEQRAVGGMLGMAVIGGPQKARDRLQQILQSTLADELIFTCDMYEFAARRHAFTLLQQLKLEAS